MPESRFTVPSFEFTDKICQDSKKLYQNPLNSVILSIEHRFDFFRIKSDDKTTRCGYKLVFDVNTRADADGNYDFSSLLLNHILSILELVNIEKKNVIHNDTPFLCLIKPDKLLVYHQDESFAKSDKFSFDVTSHFIHFKGF